MARRSAGPNKFPLPRPARPRRAEDDNALSSEEFPEGVQYEGGFTDPEEAVKFYLGDVSPEAWEKAQEVFSQLRGHIDEMQWFSIGPNSVGAEKQGQKWSELVFAPRDDAHEQELTALLESIGIYPWPEVDHNVRVLVVENRRDIALLRSALIFEHLMNKIGEVEREQALAELRAEQAKYQQEYDVVRAERARLEEMRIDREAFLAKNKREREEALMRFLESIPKIDKEILEARPETRDRMFQFPYGPTRLVSSEKRKKKEGEHAQAPIDKPLFDVDEALKYFEEDFDAGRINDDTLVEGDPEVRNYQTAEQKRVEMPYLAFFPKKYRWEVGERNGRKKREEGKLIEIETGREVTEEEIREQIAKFQNGEGREREEAFKELVAMNRQFLLYLLRQVRRRHPYADPDDLFQRALYGVMHAADRFGKNGDDKQAEKFRSYLAPVAEGYMRDIAATTRQGAVYASNFAPALRRQIYQAKSAVFAADPTKPPQDEDVARVLHERGALKIDSTKALDRYVRKSLFVYEETDPLVVDEKYLPDVDVSMLGVLLHADPDQLKASDAKELKQVVSKMLSSLSPREERVLRHRFGLSVSGEHAPERVYETLVDEAHVRGENATIESVKKRIHDLTAFGDLSQEKNYNLLSIGDKIFFNRYMELVGEIHDELKLEEVGAVFSVTRERVRQIEMKALRKLKHPSRSRKLEIFLSEASVEEREKWRRKKPAWY